LEFHQLQALLLEVSFILLRRLLYEGFASIAQQLAFLFPFLVTKDVLLLSVERVTHFILHLSAHHLLHLGVTLGIVLFLL
jgi:hypothetical protein